MPRLAVRTGCHPQHWAAACPVIDTREAPATDAELPPSRARLDDEALVLFTSGSTGVPKGVVHTNRSLQVQWTRLKQALGVDSYRRTLCLLPVYFGHGLICNALFPLLSGLDLYLGPAFSPSALAGLAGVIDDHGITAMSSVPAVWRLALRLSGSPRRGTLQRIHCGSAPLSADLWSRIAAWQPGARVVNTYGISETASWIGGSLDGAPVDGLVGHVWGGAFRTVKSLERFDEAENTCEPEEAGYVWVRTPALMKGYFQRDDLTDAVVRGGWFYTGDTGRLSANGELVLTGRAVDEINKGGLKIQPQDVEIAAAAYPQLRDACVFPVPDELYGQNVAIAVVMEDERPETLSGLKRWMEGRLSRHKMPIAWYALDALPRTSRGKIQRQAIAALCSGRAPLRPGAFAK
jgi:acyl-CoA synthetase (AMP-forming)/AMP-acid ligase II